MLYPIPGGFPAIEVPSFVQVRLIPETALPTLYSIGAIGFPSQIDWLSLPALINTKFDKAYTVMDPVAGAPTQPVIEFTGMIW